MKVGAKVLESLAIVRFPDCDPFGHLNNSRYLDYFINAREDHLLKNYELDVYKEVNKSGLSWVIAQSQIVYLKSAMLMEQILIQSQIINFGSSFVEVEMRMYDREKTGLKSLLWVKFTHFNIITKKSEKHSDDYMNFFAALVAPVAEKSFSERVNSLREKRLLTS